MIDEIMMNEGRSQSAHSRPRANSVLAPTKNSLTEKLTSCRISSQSLFFNLDKNFNLVEVTKDESCPKIVTNTITLYNDSKRTISFSVERADADNLKYNFEAVPSNSFLKKGCSIVIQISIQVFCTTTIQDTILIKIYSRRSKSFFLFKDKDLEEVDTCPCFEIPIELESELSDVVDFDQLEFNDLIATGAYGSIYKGRWKSMEVAIKKLHTSEQTEAEFEAFKREVQILRTVHCQFVVSFIGACHLKDRPKCIVMEYVKHGNLAELIQRNQLSEEVRLKILRDVASGILFLHTNHIYHRDIKPQNILVSSLDPNQSTNAKITDFDTARFYRGFSAMVPSPKLPRNESAPCLSAQRPTLRNGMGWLSSRSLFSASASASAFSPLARTLTKAVGTLVYQSPEMLMGKPHYSPAKCDVYSFGMVMWHVLTCRPPFEDAPYDQMDSNEIQQHVISGDRLPIPDIIPEGYRVLIESCWTAKPEARPFFDEIVEALRVLSM